MTILFTLTVMTKKKLFGKFDVFLRIICSYFIMFNNFALFRTQKHARKQRIV